MLLGLRIGSLVSFLLLAALTGVAEQQAPADPAGQRDASPIVARVGGLSISASELEALTGPRLLKVRSDEYTIKRRTLDERIDEVLIGREAKRRSLTVEQLIKIEVNDKIRSVTKEEAKAVLDSAPGRFDGTEGEALEAITNSMVRQRVALRRAELVRGLRASERVQILLDPPRVDLAITAGPTQGPESAPVTIVAFTDFECPFCSRAATTLRSLLERYDGRGRLVFKNYPLSIHKYANRAGEAAACADEQGHFWEMHNKLFERQNDLSDRQILRLAQDTGLEMERFNDCLASGRGADKVKRDRG